MNKKLTLQLTVTFFIAGLLLIGSCKKDVTPININYAYSYYPVDTGHYVIYNVDSILYSYNGIYTRDTVHYQWKELIADTFYDNQNRINYRLECYRRPDSTYPWNINRVWYAVRNTYNLQVQEDDIRFVKLIFPPQLNATWNGNEYVPITNNSSDPYSIYQNWNYFYENIDTTYSLNGNVINNAIVVSEVDEENKINKTLRTESYAPGIGMIYQKLEVLNKQNVLNNFPQGTENGFSIEMKLWAHYP